MVFRKTRDGSCWLDVLVGRQIVAEAVADLVERLHAEQIVEIVGRHTVLRRTVL